MALKGINLHDVQRLCPGAAGAHIRASCKERAYLRQCHCTRVAICASSRAPHEALQCACFFIALLHEKQVIALSMLAVLLPHRSASVEHPATPVLNKREVRSTAAAGRPST